MGFWQKLLKRLIDPRNWLSLIVLVIGVASVFGIPQERFGWSDQDVIVGLLIFLLVEHFGTNLFYLASLDEKMDRVRVATEGIDHYFKLRKERRGLGSLIAQAQWMRVSGLSLDNFIGNFQKLIEESATNGAKFEILICNSNVKFLDELSPSNFYTGDKYRRDIQSAQHSLDNIATEKAKQNITVRQTPSVPFASVIQVKLRDGSEYMCVEFYIYKIEGGAARSFEIHRDVSPTMFAYFEKSERLRWEDAALLPQAVPSTNPKSAVP